MEPHGRSARASQKQGPAALTGGLRPLPLLLQPKTGRPPGGATAAWELIGCPARGHHHLPCPVCELPLVNCSWQGRSLPPPFTQPIPLPSARSSASQRAGQTPTVRCKKEPLTSVPTHCQVAKPPVHPSSWHLPVYLLIPDAPRSQGACIPAQLQPHSLPRCLGKVTWLSRGDTHTAVPRLKQTRLGHSVSSGATQCLRDVTPCDLGEAAPQQETGVG